MSTGNATQTQNGSRLLVEEIQDQFLICQICHKAYSRPKNLPCLHTFCLKCIETTHEDEMTSRKYGDPREVTCPICRKRSQLPVGGARNLTDNFLVINLAELVDRQKASSEKKPALFCDICKEENSRSEKKPSKEQLSKKRNSFMNSNNLSIRTDRNYETDGNGTCDNVHEDVSSDGSNDVKDGKDNNNNKPQENGQNGYSNTNGDKDASSDEECEVSTTRRAAVSKCLECSKMLCSSCIEKHQAMKVTSRHSMIDVETEKDVECREHPGEPVRFFCDPCQMCVCVLCAFNSHKEHEVEHFSDAAQKHRDPLKNLIDVCKNKISDFNKTFDGLGFLEMNLKKVEDLIRETSTDLVLKIRQQERSLLESLQSEYDPNVLNYVKNKKDLILQMETLENTCSLAKIVVESNDVEMLLLKKEVEEKLAALSQVGLKELPEDVLRQELVFSPGSAELGQLIKRPIPTDER